MVVSNPAFYQRYGRQYLRHPGLLHRCRCLRDCQFRHGYDTAGRRQGVLLFSYMADLPERYEQMTMENYL